MRHMLALVLLLALAGCTTISANPIADLPKTHLGGVVIQGLQDASFNLDSAVTVGALTAADPAPPCFHAVLTRLGADPANPTPTGAEAVRAAVDAIKGLMPW